MAGRRRADALSSAASAARCEWPEPIDAEWQGLSITYIYRHTHTRAMRTQAHGARAAPIEAQRIALSQGNGCATFPADPRPPSLISVLDRALPEASAAIPSTPCGSNRSP
eukprot:9478586-Pyramimonas_sp.AAC.1